MKRRLGKCHAILCFSAIAAATGIANAQQGSVYIGTDYLTTGTGTEATFPFPTGNVEVKLKGVPVKGNSWDTTVARTGIATFKKVTTGVVPDSLQATIPIQLTSLSLTGTVEIGTTKCTVDITLDPSNLANDVGTMTLTETSTAPPSGKFSSMLNVYYEATFTPSTCPVPMNPIFGSYTLTQQNGKWSSQPPAGAYLTVEPYGCIPTNPPTQGACLGTPAQSANSHSGLPAGVTDFYLTSPGIENGPTAAHIVCAALESSTGETCKK